MIVSSPSASNANHSSIVAPAQGGAWLWPKRRAARCDRCVMALFKESEVVRPSASAAFDRLFRVGNDAAYEGIYRCTGCGLEIAAIGGRPLPSAKQRPHPNGCRAIQWKLIVSTSLAPELP